ncbi:hypothetical protein BpHYR1_045892 [Brachionus plicatilis]|uniref:Uncharacterized protein n=1 Tax=Brachionus plicatilis TaxID=10195 RepID=A0A3M7S7R3_BRAPC|nr:hypothetical protein BpHYR1_045892 [Brachionus plicatilis]
MLPLRNRNPTIPKEYIHPSITKLMDFGLKFHIKIDMETFGKILQTPQKGLPSHIHHQQCSTYEKIVCVLKAIKEVLFLITYTNIF